MKGLGELGIFPILFVCTLDMSMNVLLLAAPAAGGEGAGQARVKPRVTLRDPQPSSSHPASPTDTAVQHTTGEGNHCMTPSPLLMYPISPPSCLQPSPLLIYPISPPSCLQLSPRYPSYIQMHAKLLESVKVF